MSSRFNKYDVLIALVFAYLLIAQLCAVWPFTVDDMYIPLRYAQHWVAGSGIVWNVNEPPVEGYSNFSFFMLGALALRLHLDPVLFLKAAGCLGLVLTLFAVYWLGRFKLNRQLAFLPCIGLLMYPGQIIWAASGLETAMYEGLICAAAYCALRGLGYQHDPGTRDTTSPLWMLSAGMSMAISGLTRPEAPALMILFLFLIVWDRPSDKGEPFYKSVCLYLLPLVFIYLPYFVWRYQYFGLLFPNPIYCKGVSKEVGELDIAYWNIAKVFMVFALLTLREKRSYFLLLPSVLYLILLIRADSIVSFYNRLFLPSLALLLPLAAWGVQTAVHAIYQKLPGAPLKSPFYVGVLIVIYGLFLQPMPLLSDYQYFTQNPLVGEQLRSKVIAWLKQNAQHQDQIVLGDSGKIPFEVDRKFIDSFCLNNKMMAKYPDEKREQLFCAQTIKEQPKFIVVTSLSTDKGYKYHGGDHCLKPWLERSRQYQLKQIFSDHSSRPYIYEIYQKI